MVFFPRQDSLEIIKDFYPTDRSFTCDNEIFTFNYTGESARVSFRSKAGYLLNFSVRIMDVQTDPFVNPILFDLLTVELHRPIYGAGGSVRTIHSCSLERIASLRGQDHLEGAIMESYSNFSFRQELDNYQVGPLTYDKVWMTSCDHLPKLIYAGEVGLVEFEDTEGESWVYEGLEFFDQQFASNISLPDSNGINFSLFDLKHDVVLLSFWASWSLPSRQENRITLNTIYENFKDRNLEIFSISLDTEKEEWQEAIREDGASWIQVSDLQGNDSAVFDNYQIRSLPAIYVLGKDKRILTSGLTGKTLEDFVESLFN